MENIILSVLVIVYNQEKYIGETLNSILSQKHSYKYEILVLDDCSTDDSRSVINEYAEKYPFVIKPIFNETNLGLIKNYYKGIANCTGKYIMECAGDDYWLPGKVETQLRFMEECSDIGMCYGQAKIWNENKKQFSPKPCGSDKKDFYELIVENGVPALTVCFRKELIDRYVKEINPVEQSWKLEDYPIWLWFSRESKIFFIDKIFGVYRYISNSISHSKDLEKQISFEKSVNDMKSFFCDKYDYHSLQLLSESRIKFKVFYESLINEYNKDVAKQLILVGKDENTLTMKNKLICFFCKNKILFKIWVLLKKIKSN